MMKFSDLEPHEQADLLTHDAAVRARLAAFARISRDSNAAMLDAFVKGRVTPVLAKLDADEAIPTKSGLAGITQFSAADLSAAQAMLDEQDRQFLSNITLIVNGVGINAG